MKLIFLIRKSISLSAAGLFVSACLVRTALPCHAALEKGGLADRPAIETYAEWMQFANPSDWTPAIDQDGCLNYALAKLAVRYNLPVASYSVFTDSYTFYTTFVQTVLTGAPTKEESFSAYFSDFVTLVGSVPISGTAEESIQAAYQYCSATDITPQHAYILRLVTGSGSDHYVLVDQVQTQQQVLSILDSGSQWIHQLGDAASQEKGYRVVQIYTFSFSQVPGDWNGDFQITYADAEACMQALTTASTKPEDAIARKDAVGDGTITLADVRYLAKFAEASGTEADACCLAGSTTSIQTESRAYRTPVLPADVIPFVRQMTEQSLQLPTESCHPTTAT